MAEPITDHAGTTQHVQHRPTVVELAAAFASGESTPIAATEAALQRIADYDDVVNAMVLVDADSALQTAHAATRRWEQGHQLSPVDGIPTTIKDILRTNGWPTLKGSGLIDASGADTGGWTEDSPSAARLREAGCVFLGKTTMPEFAWKGVTDSSRHGATGSPWGAGLTPGGSSGGGATAVGLGMGAWTVGTDGGGSVRIPAAFTSTVALKPTYGLIPLFPASPYGTLAHAGPMTLTVTDAAMMLDLLTRSDPRDWSAVPSVTSGSFTDGLDEGVEGMKIALSLDLGFGYPNDPEVEQAVRVAAQVLADAGAEIVEVDPGITDPVDAFHTLWFTGAAKVIEGFGNGALERVDPGLREAIGRFAEGATASDYLDAMAVRMNDGRIMAEFHETYDALLTPTVPIPPFETGLNVPRGSEPGALWTAWTPYTYPFNMTQQPALSVPCGFTGDQRPIGLQIVGPRFADRRVLRVGRAYERATSWSETVPTLLAGESR